MVTLETFDRLRKYMKKSYGKHKPSELRAFLHIDLGSIKETLEYMKNEGIVIEDDNGFWQYKRLKQVKLRK